MWCFSTWGQHVQPLVSLSAFQQLLTCLTSKERSWKAITKARTREVWEMEVADEVWNFLFLQMNYKLHEGIMNPYSKNKSSAKCRVTGSDESSSCCRRTGKKIPKLHEKNKQNIWHSFLLPWRQGPPEKKNQLQIIQRGIWKRPVLYWTWSTPCKRLPTTM